MTHNHFYDGDAAPLTGKSPVQVRVRGGTMSEATLAGVRGVLNGFLGGARISLAQNLQKAVTLPGGVTVRMSSRYGAVSVDVDIPPTEVLEDDTSEFYGGIVIRPIYYPDESTLFGPSAPSFSNEGSPVPEVTSSGEDPGRPAVPGIETTDVTNWLVVQIARDKPLDDEPVRNGAVRIYRIKDPLVGNRIETNFTPERYLLSASDSLNEFYICGVRAQYLPAVPVPSSPSEARIRTLGFQPTSFEQAAKTNGIVIVAADRELYAIDTGNRPPEGMPTWQLLATGVFDDPIQYLNEFGLEFTEEVSPLGVVTVTCSGANGAGVCSGFRVTITPVPNARPILAGEIFLMHDGSVPAVPNVYTYEATLDFSGTMGTEAAPPTPFVGPLKYRDSTILYSVTRYRSAGAPEERRDRQFGGVLPTYSSGELTQTVNINAESLWGGFLTGAFTAAIRYDRDWLVEMEDSYNGSTSDLRTTTTVFTSAGSLALFDGSFSGGLPPVVSNYTRTTSVGTTSFPFDPVEEWKLTGGDVFRAILWRRRAARTAELTPYGVETGTFSEPPGPVPSEVEETTEYSALSLSSVLMRKEGAETLVEWGNAFDRFGSTPTWAGPQTYTVAPAEKYIMVNYLTGPDFVFPNPSNGTATYSDWFPAIHPTAFAVEYPGTPENITEGRVAVPTGTAPPTYSFGYAYDGSEPTTYTKAEFSAVQPQSVYAYGPGLGADTTTHINLQIATGPAATAAADTSGVASPLLLGDFTTADRAYYDIRTGGFIAQSIWTHEHSEDNHVTSLEAFIGNDVSLVPLRQVLDEWRALGGLDPATDDKRIVVWFDNFGALL